MTKNDVELKNTLNSAYTTPPGLYDGDYTKTTQFMLASVSIDMKSRFIYKYFMNSYLDDKGHEHTYTRPIFVLMGVPDFNDKDWVKAYKQMVTSKDYIFDYDIGKQDRLDNLKKSTAVNLVMIVFQVPEEFAKDYYSFKKGKYSAFSQEYKNKFPRYISGDQGKESYMWKVINRSSKLKRELEEEFNMPFGELDKPTVIHGVSYPPAEDIWDIPRKKREYYRYENISVS